MKKTFLVLITALAAVSSIQAGNTPQPKETVQYVLSKERIDSMVHQMSVLTTEEIARSAPKAGHEKNTASNTRVRLAAEQITKATKLAATSN